MAPSVKLSEDEDVPIKRQKLDQFNASVHEQSVKQVDVGNYMNIWFYATFLVFSQSNL